MSGIVAAAKKREFTETVRKFQKTNSTGERLKPTDAPSTYQDGFGMGALESVVQDILRGKVLESRATGISQSERNYQSWLEAHTDFSKVDHRYRPVPIRVVKRKGKSNLVLNKSPRCDLAIGDEWGDCEITIRKYQSATKGSVHSRMKAAGHLKLVKDYPVAWDESSMSKQVPIIGYEHRRPPTVVQLLAENYPKRVFKNVLGKKFLLQRDTSKPEITVARVVVKQDAHVERAITSNYGSPANEELDISSFSEVGDDAHMEQGREVIANAVARKSAASSKLQEKCATVTLITAEEREARRLRLSAIRNKRLNRQPVGRKGVPFYKTIQYAYFKGDEDCMGVEIEISARLCPDEEYLDWLENPEFQRAAKYLEAYNYNVPSQDQLYAFYWKTQLDDASRLQLWLAEKDCLNPTRRPQGMTKLLFKYRRSDFRLRFKQGRLDERLFRKVEDGLTAAIAHFERSRERSPFAKQEKQPLRGDGFIMLDGGEGDYTLGEKLHLLGREIYCPARASWPDGNFISQLGLDNMPPLGDGYEPMSDMEYENITRTEANSVDAHLWAEKYTEFVGPMEHFVPEETERSAILESPELEIPEYYNEDQPTVRLELGDAFIERTPSGLYLPNPNSPDMRSVVRQVSSSWL